LAQQAKELVFGEAEPVADGGTALAEDCCEYKNGDNNEESHSYPIIGGIFGGWAAIPPGCVLAASHTEKLVLGKAEFI
jgi:hypothetical protein